MTKQEFEAAANVAVTSEEFEVINTVYTFHPSIDEVKGKSQIATLYNSLGMRIIFDMVPTAMKAQALEEDIRKKSMELESLRASMEALRKGGMPC